MVGALVGSSAVEVRDDTVGAGGPLPFYGGFASAIRPDLNQPAAHSTSIVWRGPHESRTLALTFDDGPHPDWTPRVLDALEGADVPATLFLKGRNVHDHSAILRDRDPRHELGNHTWSHPDLARLDAAGCAEQLRRCTEAIEQAFGVSPTLFRPPYGHLGGASVLAAAEAGLTTVLWSAQFRESRHLAAPAGLVDDVAGHVHPGAIVLGHDTGPKVRLIAIDELPHILARLRSDGWAFTTVSALLAPTG